MNGNLDPSSNISGLVIRPTKEHKDEPAYYTTSFPPMAFAIEHLQAASGCVGTVLGIRWEFVALLAVGGIHDVAGVEAQPHAPDPTTCTALMRSRV
jgi:hypothetical protein